MAAAMASAIPVLPLVASMRVSPGLISPRSSARLIMEIAGRSLTDPAGLLPSSLHSTMLLVLPGRRCKRTSGVSPIVASMVLSIAVSPYQFVDIPFDALGHRKERRFVIRTAQRRNIGLGIALVLAFQRVGERHVFDRTQRQQFIERRLALTRPAAARVNGRDRDVVEGL